MNLLQTILSKTPSGTVLPLCTRTEHQRWPKWCKDASVWVDRLPAQTEVYVSTGCVDGEERDRSNRVRRTRETYVATLAFMLDDIGTKGEEPPIPPTFKVETSPGNFQFWYVLQEPWHSNPDEARDTYKALIASVEGADKGGTNAMRWGRVGAGVNWKMKHRQEDGTPPPCSEERVGPEYTLDQLVEGFGIEVAETQATAYGETDDWDALADLREDPLGKWLEDEGHLTGNQRDGWFYFTRCPFEHASGRYGERDASYKPRRQIGDGERSLGVFRDNLHDSCAEMTEENLLEWALEQGYEPPVIEEPKAKEGDPNDVLWRYVHLVEADKFWDRVNRCAIGGQALNRKYGASTAGRGVRAGNPPFVHVEMGTNGRERRTGYNATNYIAKFGEQEVLRSMWWPGRDELFEFEGRRFVNEFYFPPVPKRGAEPFTWTAHVRAVFPQAAEHIFDFLAFTVQHPDQKVHHALVLVGGQGCGKNILLRPFGQAPHFMSTTELPKIMGQFDDWRIGFKLIVLNEAKRTRTHAADEIHNKLKDHIAAADETITLNVKHGKGALRTPNLANIVITTNYGDSLHVDEDDRRYCICAADVTQKDLIDAEPTHFKRLATYVHLQWDWVLGWLLERDVSAFDPGATPPDWGGLQQMYEAGLTPEAEIIGPLVDMDRVQVINNLLVDHPELKGWSAHKVGNALRALDWRVVKTEGGCEKWMIRGGEGRKSMRFWAYRDIPDEQARTKIRAVTHGLTQVPTDFETMGE